MGRPSLDLRHGRGRTIHRLARYRAFPIAGTLLVLAGTVLLLFFGQRTPYAYELLTIAARSDIRM
ncbi:hypothetical protein [Actinomadura logoneensis]|uniref:hypothetical protein n=1 Tax=Actinomadura logoneensis TaxID=2293572 RepID=UPI0011C1AF86|nr:hypothetical protein [Actinomadura logoneensis]